MDINVFISENYIAIIIIAVILVMTVIGYFAQKTEFGKKVSERNQKNKETKQQEKNDAIEILSESISNEPINNESNIVTNEPEQLDFLDTIAPNFNDGGLVIGDVNQNPDKTNVELGISEDLYAPFGDDAIKTGPSIEDLKIEDVSETDDFNIVEIDNNKDNDEIDESIFQDINESLESNQDFDMENSKIDDNTFDIENQNQDQIQPETKDPVVEEINELVDNTFVINDGTDDFNDKNNEQLISSNSEDIKGINKESKVEQFDIGENDISIEEPNDLDIEKTTNLKLDEINEKIKNLKLEDLDNPNLENELISDIKKTKKKKQISVKSVDEIKKSSHAEKQPEIELEDEMALPNLDTVIENNKDVDEVDNIWNF